MTKILKDAFTLFMITLVAALALGFVNEITLEPIAVQQAKAKQEAYQTVYSEAAIINSDDDALIAKVEASSEFLASAGLSGATIDEACIAQAADGKPIGYVMTITAKEGYSGDITFTMGYKADGTMTSIEILSIKETAGLGMKATEEEFKGQFTNKKVEQFAVTKNGATSDNEIDAISAATITSSAITKAVNAGLAFANDLLASGIGGVVSE